MNMAQIKYIIKLEKFKAEILFFQQKTLFSY